MSTKKYFPHKLILKNLKIKKTNPKTVYLTQKLISDRFLARLITLRRLDTDLPLKNKNK